MAQLKVTLSIGYPTATHEEVLDIDDDDIASCETEEERQQMFDEIWNEWAWNYIDGGAYLEENRENTRKF